MDTFHEKIKSLRLSRGLSQEEIADLMGIQRSTYGNFERGSTNLFSPNLLKFAKAIGVTPEEIFSPEPDIPLGGYLAEGDLEDRLTVVEDRMDVLTRKIDVLLTMVDTLSRKSGKK